MVVVRRCERLHGSWLPVVRASTNPNFFAARRNSRARARGILNVGSIHRQRFTRFHILPIDQPRHLRQLPNRSLRGRHSGVASRDRGDVGDPPVWLVAVEDNLVIVKGHKDPPPTLSPPPNPFTEIFASISRVCNNLSNPHLVSTTTIATFFNGRRGYAHTGNSLVRPFNFQRESENKSDVD